MPIECFQVQKEKSGKFVVTCSRPPKTVTLGIFTLCSYHRHDHLSLRLSSLTGEELEDINPHIEAFFWSDGWIWRFFLLPRSFVEDKHCLAYKAYVWGHRWISSATIPHEDKTRYMHAEIFWYWINTQAMLGFIALENLEGSLWLKQNNISTGVYNVFRWV